MLFDADAIGGMEQRFRAAFINSISGFKPANLVGTADKDGKTNLAIVSSVVHLGSHPPLLALFIRPSPVERHTLENLLDSGHYTLNHVAENFIEAAHQTAARYDREQSEFAATGLTERWEPGFDAPFVAESAISMAMKLREHQALAINSTHLVIGEIVGVNVPKSCVRDDGSIDISAANTVAISGLDSYYRATRVRRMGYAKPGLPPQLLD